MSFVAVFSKLSWKAKACVVCTLCAPFYLPCAAAALIFGLMSYAELRDSSKALQQTTVVRTWRVMVVSVFLLILLIALWIQIPFALSGHRIRNEASAATSLTVTKTALTEYFKSNGGYPESLQVLAETKLVPPERIAQEQNGYLLVYVPLQPFTASTSGRRLFSAFTLTATPKWSYISGRCLFFLDQSGQIIVREPGKPDMPLQ